MNDFPATKNEEREQTLVNTLFDDRSDFWRDLYKERNVFAFIHQQRHTVALSFFDELRLPTEARILEIGCGAGWFSIDLARRGYTVEATDTADAMIGMVAKHSADAGVAGKIHVQTADVHHLQFADNSFDFLVALGVISWLHDADQGLREMFRILKPGGTAIITVNNLYRLSHLLDPLQFPPFIPLKNGLKEILIATGLRQRNESAQPHFYPFGRFDRMLRAAGFTPVRDAKFGYGPLTFFNRSLLSDEEGLRLNDRLQAKADSGSGLHRFIAAQQVVVSRKE